jgi:hypothetical protein
MTSKPANQTKEIGTHKIRENPIIASFYIFDSIMSKEETASANKMEELMALMEEEDDHIIRGNTSGGGCVKNKKIKEDEE